jgi:pimeloyl-ACP methyl ester carboxylesterase
MYQQHNRPGRTEPAPVIALHCSGAGAGQWRQLGEVLGPRYQLIAPEHYGCDHTGPWNGMHAFTLGDEAARTIELPVLVLRGEHAPRPTHLIAETLAGLLPAARLAVIDGAGHMGPLTHADAVSACMAAHIEAVEAALSSRNARDDQAAAHAENGGFRAMAEAVS